MHMFVCIYNFFLCYIWYIAVALAWRRQTITTGVGLIKCKQSSFVNHFIYVHNRYRRISIWVYHTHVSSFLSMYCIVCVYHTFEIVSSLLTKQWWILENAIKRFNLEVQCLDTDDVYVLACIFWAKDSGVSWPRYYFRVTSCSTVWSEFCTAKIKKYGQCCQIYVENFSLNWTWWCFINEGI